MKTIVHIITNLDLGGAESMLYKTLKNRNQSKYNVEVISLNNKGVYGPRIEKIGIKVYEINLKKIPSIKQFLKIRKIIKKADIVQTWMYHADFIGYFVTRFAKNKKLLWGIRRTNLNSKEIKKSTLLIAKINSILSKKIDTIISCSIAAKKTHINYGYSKENMIVIPNGFEMNNIYHDKIARNKVRKDMEIEGKKVILNIGRWNIAKDHKTLIESYKKIEDFDNHLIMIGPNITIENLELMQLINKYKIKNYSLLGPQSNINDYLSASDLYVSSSKSEGFPNVIGEAMACELPCVVTDAGDSNYIVGNTGIVVPIEDPDELAKRINQMINLTNEERQELGKCSRKRIEDKFDIKAVTKMFEAQYY